MRHSFSHRSEANSKNSHPNNFLVNFMTQRLPTKKVVCELLENPDSEKVMSHVTCDPYEPEYHLGFRAEGQTSLKILHLVLHHRK
jgi:hypothetical protein